MSQFDSVYVAALGDSRSRYCAVYLMYESKGIKNRSIGPELTTAKTGPIHLSSLVEIAFVD